MIDEFHGLHNDFSLVGEKIEVKKEMLSDYQLEKTKNKNLIPNLGNKKKIQTLLYLSLGLQ